MKYTGHLGVYICSHVFNGERPILFVSHADGDLQFLCGGYDHQPDDIRVVGIEHLVEKDHTILALEDLPQDWEAERKSVTLPWIRINPTKST